MKTEQIKKIKDKIDEEIDKTEKSVASYKEMTKPIAPDDAIGRITRMDAINNKSVAEAALRKAEEKLLKLKYVLTKINDKDFGLCARCGNPIPLGRILLMPQSRHCVHCAS
ncbi:MAG: TraR/DksA family transcriptional regulator [Bacteroidetes bacterium 4572_117]|nr:MAG: TraR/DksA family transcriptional regulator [Bacteroidetes bacterium 4572_117]